MQVLDQSSEDVDLSDVEADLKARQGTAIVAVRLAVDRPGDSTIADILARLDRLEGRAVAATVASPYLTAGEAAAYLRVIHTMYELGIDPSFVMRKRCTPNQEVAHPMY